MNSVDHPSLSTSDLVFRQWQWERKQNKCTIKVNIQEETSDSSAHLMTAFVGVLESGPTPQNYVIVEGWGQGHCQSGLGVSRFASCGGWGK
ncbi:hypothetical protein PHISCL_09358 [Aspergillus sclerotialis]|uniref:Uncharacterized protein n=1 Tax=Aspergillus sclerotialis TaxID=2070753 RepID=A0A3A2Z5D2_9EURO|nr:hypothetical protein PHISCL_09358 [Aspergillus sclerotialis]